MAVIFRGQSRKSDCSCYKLMWDTLHFRTLGYTISRETQNLQVPYFVDKDFDKAYRGASLRDLEKTIEKDYIDYIQTSCWKEKQQSKSARQASLVATSHCQGPLQPPVPWSAGLDHMFRQQRQDSHPLRYYSREGEFSDMRLELEKLKTQASLYLPVCFLL